MPSEKPSLDQNAIAGEEVTRQADAYARAQGVTDAERLVRLLTAIRPTDTDRALEIATGPGYVAMTLALRCQEVVGVDLTEAPLAIAEQTRVQRGLRNVSFRMADAEALPFTDGEF